MSQKDFYQKVLKNDLRRCQQIRSKMEEIIIKTMKTGQEAGIEHRNNSFEIYGFDFMLDKKLNPWLLEVNLSPACAERTDWLVDMLDNATDHLFDILENKILDLTDDFKQPIKQYLIQKKLNSNINDYS